MTHQETMTFLYRLCKAYDRVVQEDVARANNEREEKIRLYGHCNPYSSEETNPYASKDESK
jgi:hypothetical protein